MLSLDNVFSEEELDSWLVRPPSVRYLCELKLDGLAVNLLYLDGRLAVASTRGDGRAGGVVDELRGDAAVGAEHREARPLGRAGDLGPHPPAAAQALLGLRGDAHARFPTFRAPYSPS
mgnify:CR=1 FL=1